MPRCQSGTKVSLGAWWGIIVKCASGPKVRSFRVGDQTGDLRGGRAVRAEKAELGREDP